MSERVRGKVAVVTGSTRGIGEGIARRLAAEGAAVVVSGVDDAQGGQVARQIVEAGGQAVYIAADVTRAADCEALIRAARQYFGRVDVLVNNAGIFPSLALEENTSEMWDSIFAVNVRGAFLCCRYAIPVMQAQGSGVIINIGSSLAYHAPIDRVAYAASKAALLSMTKTLARAYLRDRIRVNWITVGWVASPGEIELRSAQHEDGAAYLEQVAAAAPLGRLETPDDVADGVLFLASDAASHVTGCELNISGGFWI